MAPDDLPHRMLPAFAALVSANSLTAKDAHCLLGAAGWRAVIIAPARTGAQRGETCARVGNSQRRSGAFGAAYLLEGFDRLGIRPFDVGDLRVRVVDRPVLGQPLERTAQLGQSCGAQVAAA